jgi:hypothetical protein
VCTLSITRHIIKTILFESVVIISLGMVIAIITHMKKVIYKAFDISES